MSCFYFLCIGKKLYKQKKKKPLFDELKLFSLKSDDYSKILNNYSYIGFRFKKLSLKIVVHILQQRSLNPENCKNNTFLNFKIANL